MTRSEKPPRKEAARKPQKPSIPLLERFVTGEVDDTPSADYCRVLLPDGRQGRLLKIHSSFELHENWGKLSAGDHLDLFLLNPVESDVERWHVSHTWASPNSNPWLQAPPHLKQTVYGQVIRYVKDYAAIVELEESGIEAFIHRADIPGAGDIPIYGTLFIGDRVCGEVSRIDTPRLEVDLDLRPVVARHREQVGSYRANRREILDDRSPSCAKSAEPVLDGLLVWVVDDDHDFRRALGNWLSELGAEVEQFRGAGALNARMAKKGRPTHLLLDRDLAQPEEWEVSLRLVKQLETTTVAVVTALPRTVDQTDFPLFSKPLNTPHLVSWLRGNPSSSEVGKPKEEEREEIWADRAFARDAAGERAEALRVLAASHEIHSALWVERTRPGAYQAVAWYGMERSDVEREEPHFGQTLVEALIERAEEEQHDRLGALGRLVSSRLKHAWGFRLRHRNGEKQCVIFFTETPLDAELRDLLRAWDQRLACLDESTELADALDEERGFAALGRFWAGYAHELRHALSVLQLTAQPLRRWIYSWDAESPPATPPQELRVALAPFRDALGYLEGVASYELGRVRRHAPQRVRVVDSVERLIRFARSQATEEGRGLRKESPSWREPFIDLVEAPAEEVEAALDAQALQQPLLNVLNNALHQVLPLGAGGLIQIRVRLAPSDPDGLPLHIEVEDNGPGVDAAQLARLFTPRSSTRGRTGIGLGLYVSERLLHAAGGRLELKESTRFLGSTFALRLPLRFHDRER